MRPPHVLCLRLGVREILQKAKNRVPPSLSEVGHHPLGWIGLNNRVCNCLKRAEIDTVYDLLRLDHLKLSSIKGLGPRSIDEIITKLEEKVSVVSI